MAVHTAVAAINNTSVQGWRQLSDLAVAFGLSALIGLERELRQKSAGLRTHTLVGMGSALFMLISKFGFFDVLSPGRVIVDPSRVAAQIVTGVGFIGGGLILVRRGNVRGLTTAAIVWLTAAVGAAAGAGLLILAAVVTGLHFVVMLAFSPLVHRLAPQPSSFHVNVVYEDGRGILRRILEACSDQHFSVLQASTERRQAAATPAVAVGLLVRGVGSVAALVTDLQEVDGVLSVDSAGAGETD